MRKGIRMDDFEKMLKFVLKYEGGYVNDPHDLGGETNKGITHRTYNAYRKARGLSAQSVKLISNEEVKEIYRKNYYEASGAHNIKSRKLAMLVFDTAVNMGVGRAKGFLKESNWDIKKYLFLRRDKYQEFARVNPSQKRFLQGWMNRVAALEAFMNVEFA